jgi:undecaprenyl-diphosphatase
MASLVEIIEILILAIVQGLTEWLPISSSGHLVIFQEGLGVKPSNSDVAFDIFLHAGTLTVVLFVFRVDILKILKSIFRLDFKSEDGKLALYIIVGSIPTAAIYFMFKKTFESFFHNLLVVGIALLITGLVLFFSERKENNRNLGLLDSFLVGIAQGVAIVPGVSRSGVTIGTGLLRKVKKEIVFKFSFLLSIPAILGAVIDKFGDLTVNSIDFAPLLLGFVVSMVVGYFSLKLLLKIVLGRKFHMFAYYCWLLGLAVLIFTIFKFA